MNIWRRRPALEYRTPSGRLAPYPNMTDEELDDFEDWADEVTPKMYIPVGCFTVTACLAILFLLLLFVASHPLTAPCTEFIAKRSFCQP